MGLNRHPHRGQFTRPVQLGKVDRIPPVGLDPITGLARDQRRGDDDASVPCCAQVPLNAVAARPGLIAEPQFVPAAGQLRSQRRHRRGSIRDLAVLAHLTPLAGFGKRHRNRLLVHIQTDVDDSHDPSPYA
jgi:hypothetical protein